MRKGACVVCGGASRKSHRTLLLGRNGSAGGLSHRKRGHFSEELVLPLAQITGDHVLIARETARTLGMGTDIRTPEGLPQMTEDGRMPPKLGRDYAHVILPADGFAQVRSS